MILVFLDCDNMMLSVLNHAMDNKNENFTYVALMGTNYN